MKGSQLGTIRWAAKGPMTSYVEYTSSTLVWNLGCRWTEQIYPGTGPAAGVWSDFYPGTAWPVELCNYMVIIHSHTYRSKINAVLSQYLYGSKINLLLPWYRTSCQWRLSNLPGYVILLVEASTKCSDRRPGGTLNLPGYPTSGRITSWGLLVYILLYLSLSYGVHT